MQTSFPTSNLSALAPPSANIRPPVGLDLNTRAVSSNKGEIVMKVSKIWLTALDLPF